MISETLAHYEILEQVGAGGMGEVYRARDTKLHREVAIKLLSEKLAPAPERLARFEREAHLLASLNHPNIATIHGLEKDQGIDFLVLELVEGETLAERIARGPIPLEQTLSLFEQIAHGLEAAHGKGIIHRDLKPPNIKITPEGHVKILDFGLGKVFEELEPAQVDLSKSPTLTRGGTRAGVILGTAAYMSPEQARGEPPVDKRTDIWAFGCCLYEALTGKPAFSGATVTDIIASVVKTQPDWERLPAGLPPGVRRVLQRCLEKDARGRFHDMADVRIDLEDATSVDVAVEEPSNRAAWRLPQIALLGLVLFGLGALVSSLRKPPTPELPSTRLEIEALPLDVFTRSVAFSRDGTKLAYVADEGQIYIRQMDRDVVLPLPSTKGGQKPVFSPDGQWVAFHDQPNGKLRKVPVNGGAAITLADWTRAAGFDADWESEDTIIFADGDGLYRVSASGGGRERLEVTAADSDKAVERPRYPDVLPGGHAILFTAGPFYLGEVIALHDVNTGERRVLIDNAEFARYVPTGHIVFMRDDTLHAVGFDLETLTVLGEPSPVVENIDISITNGSTQYSLSDTGSLAYVPAQWDRFRRKLVWVDMDGNVELLRSIPRRIADPQLSPDGASITLTIYEGTDSSVWRSEVSRETLAPLLPGIWSRSADWSPDGKRIVATGIPPGRERTLFVKSLEDDAEIEMLTSGFSPQWSPDGDLIAYVTFEKDTLFDLWTIPLEGERTPRPYVKTRYLEGAPAFSPDGRWLAYVSAESGRAQVYVQTVQAAGAKYPISTEGGTGPRWSPNGGEIYYRSGRKMMAVEIQTQPGFVTSPPRLLFEGDFLWNDLAGPYWNYDISPDGKRFLMIQSEEEPVFTKIKIVLNWFEELKRLVPVDN